MGEIKFMLKPVDEKPVKRSRRESKYDPILDRFISEEHDLVRVDVDDMKPYYMRTYLERIIKSRGLEDRLVAAIVDGELYLETVKGQPFI